MKTFFSLMLTLLAVSAFSQQTVEPVELLNVSDGKMIAAKPCSGCKGVVVIFTSLNCPYDQQYQERIKTLSEKYANSISFFLINPNPGEEEDEPKMKTAYGKWNLSIPYLSDKKQTALRAMGVKRTPEAVLLKPNGKNLTIVYQGAIDDNPQVHNDTGKNFLDDAIGELVSGKPVKVAAERAVGCIVRKAN